MFDDCPRFQDFRRKLESEGVTIKLGWIGKTVTRERDDLAHVTFHSEAGPAVRDAMIRSYGEDGFSIYLGTETNSMDDDVRRIVGARKVSADSAFRRAAHANSRSAQPKEIMYGLIKDGMARLYAGDGWPDNAPIIGYAVVEYLKARRIDGRLNPGHIVRIKWAQDRDAARNIAVSMAKEIDFPEEFISEFQGFAHFR